MRPQPDLQWIEDRFWIWVHYGAGKIGRGELFEALDFLAFLRGQVLGPLALQSAGARPSGVRWLERAAPDLAAALTATVATYEASSIAAALDAAIAIYRRPRHRLRDGSLQVRADAERAAVAYLADVSRRSGQPDGR